MKTTLKDKLMAEALNFYRINKMLPDDEPDTYEDEYADDVMTDMEDEGDFASMGEEDADDDVNALGDEVIDDIVASVSGSEDNMEGGMDDETLFGDLDLEDGNPNANVGLIRTVKGAYMVYKRMTPENNYEELWIYNMKDVKYQTKIRNSILAGTDVDPVTLISPDGEQRADIYSKGNVQFVHIDGLPN